jgi:hypothetical protein
MKMNAPVMKMKYNSAEIFWNVLSPSFVDCCVIINSFRMYLISSEEYFFLCHYDCVWLMSLWCTSSLQYIGT